MLDADRRPKGRFFCWPMAMLMTVLVVSGILMSTSTLVDAAPQNPPATTTVSDTVYNADGTPAQGSVEITWPAFTTADGTEVVAGSTSVALGTNGILNIALISNAGASPAGVYYSVVYQLGPGNVHTEYWVVPATSPANLAAVRVAPGPGSAGQPVSTQYVDSALAVKADDNAVVHLNGAETIGGTKTFTNPPAAPAPQNPGDLVTKSYVDSAVANVGSGTYLSTAGGTMTGPITLSGNPSAALQATPKQYVDLGLTTKADLVNGIVPTSELGTGTANAGSCLFGNGTWAACGSGGGGNVSTTPSGTQAIIEPPGALFTSNRIGQKRMADQFNWKQTPTTPASLTPGPVTVTLSPCPQGFLNTINASNANHWIYIDSGSGDAQQPGEPVLVTGENCPAGANAGTITFSVAYAHGPGYGVESGTGGIKEALVDANQVRFTSGVSGNDIWVEVTPGVGTKMKAPLYWQTTMGRLDGGMSLLECSVNMSCINIGDTNSLGFANGNTNQYTANVVDGLWMRPDQSMSYWDVTPLAPAAIAAGGTSATLTVSTCPAGFWPLIPNQILWLNGTSDGLVSTAYEAGAPGPGEFVRVTGGSCVPGASNGTITIVPATPGITTFYAHDSGYTLSNGVSAYIEDNSQGTVIRNLQTNGWVSNKGYGFIIQNDNNQGEMVENVNFSGGTRCDADFCGATLFGPGPNGINAGITNMTGGTMSTCAEWYNGNDFMLGPTVCQGFQDFALFLSTKRGGAMARASVRSVHRERGGMTNSLGLNLGAADLVVQGYNISVSGNGEGMNSFPAFSVAGNPGGQLQIYYLSITELTDGTKTVPIPIGQANVNNPAANNVTVRWVTADALAGKTINFELYRLSPSASTAGQVPYPGVCDGVGSDGTCLVASGISPGTACDIHGACTYTDNVANPGAVVPFTGSDGTGAGGYFPTFSFSPGGVVLSAGATYRGDPACIIAAGASWLNEEASVIDNGPPPANCVPSGGSYNEALAGFSLGQGSFAQWGLLFPDRNRTVDAGYWTGIKGRINFIGGGTYPRDVTTWYDANPAKTMSNKLEYGSGAAGTSFGTVNRPQWDAGDIATGVENAGSGLYERVPGNGVFDWYIGSLPNNPGGTSGNWTEELSGTSHTFKVPVTINGSISASGGAFSGAVTGLTPTSSDNSTNFATTAFVKNQGYVGSSSPVFSGTVTLPITGSGAQCLHVSGTGILSGTGSDCGNGAGGGSGTVNSGLASQVAVYSGSGPAVSGDSALTDNGSTLSYSGAGGITASSGTFSGNLTVNGQLLVAGPWTVSSPVPGSAMAAAGAGTSSLGISNDGNFYISANGETPQQIATTTTSSYFSNLMQEDANDLGEYNGTNVQGFNIYGTRTDAGDYERLALTYDTTNTSYFKIDAQAAGTGTRRGLAFWINGAGRWGIDQLSIFKPFVDNQYDIGSTALRIRNGYFGTGVLTPSVTLNGIALSSVIGTPSGALMTAGTVSGSGQPLCTDGLGALTITTVGCPPGTGTIGGSGATPQFAYWTNTNGLGAAPFYVSNSNTLEQYNGTNAQMFNVYGTYPGAGNYERASLGYVSTDGYYELQTQQAGTGLQRGFCFGVNNSCKWAVDTTTAFKPFNDNARDIGTASLRVRDLYLGRNLIMSGISSTYNGKATAGIGLTPVYGTVSLTGQTAAIASSTLCATSTCGSGQYEVTYYINSTASCTTAGSAAATLTVGWSDDVGAKALQVPLNGLGVGGGNSLSLGNVSNFGSGSITLWSAGTINLTYATTYAGCSSGTGTYAVRLVARQLQ